MTYPCKEIAELNTTIRQIEEGRRMDVASWRGKLAKAKLKIAEQERVISSLRFRLGDE